MLSSTYCETQCNTIIVAIITVNSNPAILISSYQIENRLLIV